MAAGKQDPTGAKLVADAIKSLAVHVKYLGGGENADQRGAVEFLAIQTKDGADAIATALDDVSMSLDRIADAIHTLANSVREAKG